MFESFTKVYKLSKTLKFELRPIGKTLDNIKASGVLDRDFARAGSYPHVKDVLDAEHKALLERALLREIDINWEELAEQYRVFRASDKGKAARDAIEAENAACREKIVEAFTADKMYSALTEATPSKFFKLLLKAAEDKKEAPDANVERFASFACYFKGYQENRENIYSKEKQTTAAANRAINENFPRFLDCCAIFRHIEEKYPSIIAEAEKELAEILDGLKLKDMFAIGNYGKCLPQSGIEAFNHVVGGKSPERGKKTRGINEFINLYRQQHDDAKADRLLAKMPILYKQILSDRETISFVAEAFEKDADVLNAVRKFGEELKESGVVGKLRAHLANLSIGNGIYIDSEKLPDVSRVLCGSWSVLGGALEQIADEKVKDLSTEKKREDAKKAWLNRAEYPLSDFAGITIPDDSEAGFKAIDICDAWRCEDAVKIFDAVDIAFKAAQPALCRTEENGLRDKNREDDVALIKAYLDSVQDVLHLVKPLHVSAELERDMAFYGDFDPWFNSVDQIVPLYNRVRNYITQKPSESKKMKLMFDCSTLADGWDQNKENDNKAILLEKNGLFYLGIVKSGRGNKIDFSKLESSDGECYRKMVYKLLPGPNKMLPRVFFSNKGLPIYKPSEALLKKYQAGLYKKGRDFDLFFCRQLIDFFKKSISIRPSWSTFGFKFSPTDSYNGIDDFYREISEQAYRVKFVDIPCKTIDSLVDNGLLYLFQIHNKDFLPSSTGKANLHTIYWRNLFNPANLENLVLKLNGEAELFYRPASIATPYTHSVGEKMVNRLDKDGRPIPETAFGELFAFANGRRQKAELSSIAAALWDAGKVTVKNVTHPITKDARYTRDEFFFHVPISLNANAADRPSRFNDMVNFAVRDEESVNVIGIDRGERHLLYVTVVNPKGEILEQRSFNVMGRETHDGNIAEVDYHAKLDQSEKARDAARKSWTEIGRIKDLKAGYLSIVVHEIATMMLKYNAVITLEDLNFGFKRGRFAIEKQVYQKFEKALIDKLNYLSFKDVPVSEPGGVLNAYQFTDKFVSFDRLGKQTGFIYYVPAAYTSKIDPTTGFTNLFDLKKCTNAENIRSFFGLFKAISYSKQENAFAFTFDYNNFKTRMKGWKTEWTVYSSERRLVFDRAKNREVEIFPTRIILEKLEARGVKVEDGFDLKAYLLDTAASRENAAFFRDVFYAFERTLQMRNSSAATGEDYIQSPVKNSSGGFFDSRSCGGNLPQNADANGAYHIALKGLWIVSKALKTDERNLKLEHETWFEFAQSRH